MGVEPLSIVYVLDMNMKEYGNSFLYLHVFLAESRFVQHAIDGAVDNKAGYGDVRTARKMEEWYRKLLSEGYTHYYSTSYGGSHAGFRIKWLYYTGERSSGYCQHRFEELGDSHIDSFGPSMKLLSDVFKTAKKMFPTYSSRDSSIIDAPSIFLSALDQIGTRVVRVDKAWEDPLTYVADKSPRLRLRDEDVISMFEGRERSLRF